MLNESQPSPGEDMIEGAGSIAKFVFGSEKERRKIYHIFERHDFPAFKIGGKLYARKSSILKWLAEKEQRAA